MKQWMIVALVALGGCGKSDKAAPGASGTSDDTVTKTYKLFSTPDRKNAEHKSELAAVTAACESAHL